MKFFAFATLVSMALAAPGKAPTPLDVTLEAIGNSGIKATITNTGKNNLKVLKTGSLLDSTAVEKVKVTQGELQVPFDGVRLRLATDALTEANFQQIPAGETIELTWDIAQVHNLAAGGKFDVSTEGVLAFAEENGTKLIGSIPYSSNKVETVVDGSAARKTHLDFKNIAKRTRVQSSCNSRPITTGLSGCASLARAAQTVATSGSASKMTEFFKSSTSATRNTVATVFSRIASECSSTSSGNSYTYCTDVYSYCSGGVLAYTLPSNSYIVYCPLSFSAIPVTSSGCRTQTLDNTILHETTHLTSVKGTQDYNGYGYDYVRSLSAAQNLNHADTYTLFAQSIKSGC